jgi:HEAT repeat protein
VYIYERNFWGSGKRLPAGGGIAAPFFSPHIDEVYAQLDIVREATLPLAFYRQLKNRKLSFQEAKQEMQHERFQRKRVAITKLGDLRDERAVLTLVAVVEDKLFVAPKDFEPEQKSRLRKAAAAALGKIGGPVALAKLNDLLNSKDPKERKMASEDGFSGASGGQAATHLLTALKKEMDLEVKAKIIIALGNIGGGLSNQAKELIVKELIRQMENKELIRQVALENNTAKEVLRAAIEALGKQRLKSATEPLLTQLNKLHQDEILAEAIVIALGNIGDEGAVNLVVVMLEVHAKKRVRSAAALALGKIGGSKAMAALKRRRDLEKEQSVKSDILKAMTPVIHWTFP